MPATMPFIRPSLGPVAAAGGYGWRQLPREPRTWHDGLDFVGAYGSPIKAVKAGVVVAAAPNGTYNRYGNLIVIKHDDASDGAPYSLYAHLSAMRVRKGQHVRAGQIIGAMGNLAATKAEPWKMVRTHLHFELPSRFPLPEPDTGRINPTPYIALAQRAVQAATTPPTYASASPALYPAEGTSPLLYSQASPMLSELDGDMRGVGWVVLGMLAVPFGLGWWLGGRRCGA